MASEEPFTARASPPVAGGTGLTSYTAGDLPYYASGSALSKLAIGTANYVLTSSGTAPQYVAQSTLSVGTATNATNTAITDNTSSSATWYPTIVSATTGNLPQTTSSTKLSFVPSTGILTSTGFSGAHNGTVGATTPSTGAFTTITASSTITPSTTSGIVGTTLADSANAGSVGEFVDSYATVTLQTSATLVTSISLTAGDWDVYGNISLNGGTVGVTTMATGISATSGSFTGSLGKNYVVGTTNSTTATGQANLTLRVNISSTTTYYLNGSANVANAGYGYISARRRR